MKIGGLLKNSLIDYPEKISCVVFLSGCNFHCPYCHNPDLACGILPDEKVTKYAIFDYIATHVDFLDGVVISGGEPTLQGGLLSFCKKIKDIGNYPIKLDTNGSRPDVIMDLIEHNAIDYIAMDIKTETYRYSSLCNVRNIENKVLQSIEIIKNSGIDYEFRTTCVKPYVATETIKHLTHVLKGAKKYVLQRFVRGIVLRPDLYLNNALSCSDVEIDEYKNTMNNYVENCSIR